MLWGLGSELLALLVRGENRKVGITGVGFKQAHEDKLAFPTQKSGGRTFVGGEHEGLRFHDLCRRKNNQQFS